MGYGLKRVVFPSGKTIKVVYFSYPAEAPAEMESQIPAEEKSMPDHGLHVCDECGSHMADEFDRFVHALEVDGVLPEDF